MAERKRAGARRSLAAAAGATRRRYDDSAGGAVEHPQQPDQITMPAPAAVTEPVLTPPEPRPVPPAKRAGSKYTAMLDDDVVDAFEQVTRIARRRLGRHVDKIEVLSALLLLAADDANLRDQVVGTIGARPR
ncbi:hypothetical protein [Pseudonocardia sp. Ae505_Ps2]|uniref:hypothetical protein n=1 Tax=Pseudonocardia sp. Ae505_Ps2 TaxID=1885034 RepID=UPI000A7E07B5|nr:hypothetical protein [Pseudonocardia sp. Ae505_Ps2]